MRYRPAQQPPAFAKINVTPLIDVVMVLIVFYLIVGKLASARQPGVDLPVAQAGQSEQHGGLVINIVAREGASAIVIDGRDVAPATLTDALKSRLAATPGLPVQIRADRRLKYASIQPVLDSCRDAGLSTVRLATERGGAP